MTPQELFDRFRSEVQDEEAPYLWSDTEVWSYMDWAHKEFVRLIGGVADSQSDITQITATEGLEFTEFSDLILKFRRAHRLTDFRKVDIVNLEDLDKFIADDYGLRAAGGLNDTQGSVRAMVIGMEENSVRWIDIPDTTVVIQLSVMRLPLYDIVGESGECFEVRREFHLDLLPGMQSRALMKTDAETFDDVKAAEYLKMFHLRANEALRTQDLRRHKNRVVAYGGL